MGEPAQHESVVSLVGRSDVYKSIVNRLKGSSSLITTTGTLNQDATQKLSGGGYGFLRYGHSQVPKPHGFGSFMKRHSLAIAFSISGTMILWSTTLALKFWMDVRFHGKDGTRSSIVITFHSSQGNPQVICAMTAQSVN